MDRKKQKAAGEKCTAAPEPVDVVDGLADRSRNPAAWKYVILAAIFVLWAALLVYCLTAGAPR